MPIRWPPRNTITLSRLILCEGPSDEAFFRTLIEMRRLPEFSIRHTGDADLSRIGSITKFGLLLEGIPSWVGFDLVTDIVIIANNDDDPAGNFGRVCEQIRNAAPFGTPPRSYDVPSIPLEKTSGAPTIPVMMIPAAGRVGNLETLCLEAAVDSAPAVASCVDELATCTGAAAWPEKSRLGTMKLRCILASRHKPNPFIGLGNVWREVPSLIPLNHTSFVDVANFLEGYRT